MGLCLCALFTVAIVAGQPVWLFNSGHMRRDFTSMNDVVEAVARLITAVVANNFRAPRMNRRGGSAPKKAAASFLRRQGVLRANNKNPESAPLKRKTWYFCLH